MTHLRNVSRIQLQIWVLDTNGMESPIHVRGTTNTMAVNVSLKNIPKTKMTYECIKIATKVGSKYFRGIDVLSYIRKIDMIQSLTLDSSKTHVSMCVNTVAVILVVPDKTIVNNMFNNSLNVGVSKISVSVHGKDTFLGTDLTYTGETPLVIPYTENEINNKTNLFNRGLKVASSGIKALIGNLDDNPASQLGQMLGNTARKVIDEEEIGEDYETGR
jgi:hypothetical protein